MLTSAPRATAAADADRPGASGTTCGGGGIARRVARHLPPAHLRRPDAHLGPAAAACGGRSTAEPLAGIPFRGGGANVCGSPARQTAQPMTRAGPAGDGCGGTLDSDLPSTTCGGGGVPGVCNGRRMCRPRPADQTSRAAPRVWLRRDARLRRLFARPHDAAAAARRACCGAPVICDFPRTCAQQMLAMRPRRATAAAAPSTAAPVSRHHLRRRRSAGMCGAPACRPRTPPTRSPVRPGGRRLRQRDPVRQLPVPADLRRRRDAGRSAKLRRVPRTCAGANAECAPVADGCGGVLDWAPPWPAVVRRRRLRQPLRDDRLIRSGRAPPSAVAAGESRP